MCVGYVYQRDVMLPFQTVRETVTFHAKLKNVVQLHQAGGTGFTGSNKVQNTSGEAVEKNASGTAPNKAPDNHLHRLVSDTLALLHIDHIADLYVGDSGSKTISGGERKRVAIACELVARPRILFLDEPTSGLDSLSSLRLMVNLRRIAREERSIMICTIHQPEPLLWEQFDRVLCMRSGRILFHGWSHAQHGDLFSGMDGSQVGMQMDTSSRSEQMQDAVLEGRIEAASTSPSSNLRYISHFLKHIDRPLPPAHGCSDWLIYLAQTVSESEARAIERETKKVFDSAHGADFNGESTAGRGAGNSTKTETGGDTEMKSTGSNPGVEKGELQPLLEDSDKPAAEHQDRDADQDPSQPATLHPSSSDRMLEESKKKPLPPFFSVQIPVLFRRHALEDLRQVVPFSMRLLTPALQVLLMGIAFWQIGTEFYAEPGMINGTPLLEKQNFLEGFRNLSGATLNMYTVLMFTNAGLQTTSLMRERKVFLREYSGGMYSVPAYLLAKMLFELCVTPVQVGLVYGIAHGMLGLFPSGPSNATQPFLIMFNLLLTGLAGGSL
ncbi:unnamed protein product, partial [Amoebophrya sp. A25]|eukprot:GSA25T00023906001.1